MPRTSTSSSRTSSTRTTARRSTAAKADANAVELLTADHKAVDALFKKFEKKNGRSTDDMEALVQQICRMLEVHATIEEEIFYPAARESLGDEPKPAELLNEAEVEHEHIKSLVEQLKDMDSDDELFDARVTVLKEYVKHHVEEEENELFPKVKKSDLDLDSLGEMLRARKAELEETQ